MLGQGCFEVEEGLPFAGGSARGLVVSVAVEVALGGRSTPKWWLEQQHLLLPGSISCCLLPWGSSGGPGGAS